LPPICSWCIVSTVVFAKEYEREREKQKDNEKRKKREREIGKEKAGD